MHCVLQVDCLFWFWGCVFSHITRTKELTGCECITLKCCWLWNSLKAILCVSYRSVWLMSWLWCMRLPKHPNNCLNGTDACCWLALTLWMCVCVCALHGSTCLVLNRCSANAVRSWTLHTSCESGVGPPPSFGRAHITYLHCVSFHALSMITCQCPS